MIYLLLAILSSACVSVFMRFSEGKVQNRFAMFMANYLICVVISLLFKGDKQLLTSQEGIGFAIGLGVFSGIMYLGSFLLLQMNIRKNGVVMSSTFMKLGVLVPTLMAIWVFHETPGVWQILGFAIAILAILVISFEGGIEKSKGGASVFLIVLLLASGLTDSLANIYEKAGDSTLKDHYLFYTFVMAWLLCVIILMVQRKKIKIADLGFGALIGVPNYFSARFLLLALSKVPAIITYPACNVCTIVLVTMAGLLLFKEKISRQKGIALVMILVAIALLNV